ncbi:glycosyltransferase family 2 protein [Candidatus Dojkabacteria bacterium]|jgi:cellulose synthase/poly-beta-1,6-N-acetylglucosamine synthase-like glycosyltransferase|nr:glycosyltransferase family 2 protein [Candidatus Dojkabacteria bacterium]
MISVILVAYKEPISVIKAIKCIADQKYSGIPSDFELIQVSPDDETLSYGLKEATRLNLGRKFIQIKDPLKGKPFALNMAFKQAKGEILVLTDGDVYLGESSISLILSPFSDPNVGGVTGRPISSDLRTNFWGYISHLLTDAANHKRENTINKGRFFPMSGYFMAIRNSFAIPDNLLSEDAYISYLVANSGKKIEYIPKALVFVKFPKTFKDYLTQKVRSLGGYIQLERLGISKEFKQSRSFFIELKYAIFTLTYGKNIREFIWSVIFFPIRLYTWIVIFIKRMLLKKVLPEKGWERILSTK